MCGIAGYVLRQADAANARHINRLLNPIQSRGPDDEGVAVLNRQARTVNYFRTDKTVPGIAAGLSHALDVNSHVRHDAALIHTRYSIIDLSDGGHQPFASHDGAVVAVVNGEIYNYIELRKELEQHGIQFRSSSDTEVLVEGYRYWSDELWEKLNGFWAAAIYDNRDGSVVLSRDRIGIAPLYYRHTEDGTFFASSIQSLVDIAPEGIEIDSDVATGFIDTAIKDFEHKTYYKQIHSLQAGLHVRIDNNQCNLHDASQTVFWKLPESRIALSDWSFDDAVEQYRDTFLDAVGLRLRADVKVACELSGGLDSSSIVAAAAGIRDCDITTYTIKVPRHDEEPYARAILERYDVDYRVLHEPEQTFATEIDSFTQLMEEPYHSPNIYTHYKMRQEMKAEGVGVVLTGSGGDEVLAGYERSFWARAADEMRAEGCADYVRAYDQAKGHNDALRVKRSSSKGPMVTTKRLIRKIFGNAKHSFRSVLNSRGHPKKTAGSVHKTDISSKASVLRHEYDSLSYFGQRRFHFETGLLPYYLRSNDHFSLGIPLEARFPFLDHRMVELGMKLPPAYLFKDGWTKYILRKAMEPLLPEKILWRRLKMGFPFPYRRFLNQNKQRLAPMVDLVRRHGIETGVSGQFDALVKSDPVRTWRICSTGLWLEGLKGVDVASKTSRV